MIGLIARVLRATGNEMLPRCCGFGWLLVDAEHAPIITGNAGSLATTA